MGPKTYKKLEQHLLSIAGDSLAGGYKWAKDQITNKMVATLLKEGVPQDGHNAPLYLGPPSECHSNAPELAMAHGWRWYFGYALSPDGLWRIHSWCVRNDFVPVETTVPREMYFGCRAELLFKRSQPIVDRSTPPEKLP